MDCEYDKYECCGGSRGPKGCPGEKGKRGKTGPTGATGMKGMTGMKGDTGATGPAGGDTGAVGPTGATGDKGMTGDQGMKGMTGDKGPDGDKGMTGDQGPAGVTGPDGDKGMTGDKGPDGDKGMTGDIGQIGPIGPTGPAGGATGPQGPTGPAAPPGSGLFVFTSANSSVAGGTYFIGQGSIVSIGNKVPGGFPLVAGSDISKFSSVSVLSPVNGTVVNYSAILKSGAAGAEYHIYLTALNTAQNSIRLISNSFITLTTDFEPCGHLTINEPLLECETLSPWVQNITDGGNDGVSVTVVFEADV